MTAWRACAGAGIFSALAAAGSAPAAMVLQLDVNHVVVEAADAAGNHRFDGPAHTGTLALKMGADTKLADVLIDGAWQDLAGAELVDLAGEIRLVGGMIAGGDLSLTVLDALGEQQAYTFDLVAGGGGVYPSDSPYMLVGDTAQGLFSDPRLGAVDVSLWHAGQPVPGAILLDDYRPDAAGSFNAAHLEVLAVAVPEPAMSLAAAPIVMGLLRRRRRAF